MIPLEDLRLISDGLGKDVHRFNGKTILIAGGAGFLGRVCISFFKYINEHVLFQPIKIICLDNYIARSDLEDSCKDNPNIEVIHHDITKPIWMKIKKGQKIDFIINLSGIAAPSLYKRYPEETLDVSYTGTINILQLAYNEDVESVLSFSSSEIYATPPDDLIPTPESYIGQVPTMDTRSCYDVGKLVLETINHTYYTHKGVNCKIARPFNVYAYSSITDTRVLPNFIKAILKNENLKVYSENNNTRTFCFITDAITGFLKILLLGKIGNVYNIGCEKPEITMKDLAELVLKISGNQKSKVEIVPYPSYYPSTEPARRCPDISKAKDELGYSPRVSLEEGIKKYYNWAKESYTL
jgi:UDP-glucuronate decarboxylase